MKALHLHGETGSPYIAAPELLVALQWLLDSPNEERGSHTAITYANEIIAKATGSAA